MSSLKRKSSSDGLQRRVRARREPSEEIAPSVSEQSEHEEVVEQEGSDNSNSTDGEEDEAVSFERF